MRKRTTIQYPMLGMLQYCIYNNSLWKCLVQHSGQTPTEGTYWTNVTVANEITSVNNSINKLYCFDKDLTGTYLSAGSNTVDYEIDIPSECPFIPRYVFSQTNHLAAMYTASKISNGKIQVRVCSLLSGTFSVNFKFMLVELVCCFCIFDNNVMSITYYKT